MNNNFSQLRSICRYFNLLAIACLVIFTNLSCEQANNGPFFKIMKVAATDIAQPIVTSHNVQFIDGKSSVSPVIEEFKPSENNKFIIIEMSIINNESTKFELQYDKLVAKTKGILGSSIGGSAIDLLHLSNYDGRDAYVESGGGSSLHYGLTIPEKTERVVKLLANVKKAEKSIVIRYDKGKSIHVSF